MIDVGALRSATRSPVTPGDYLRKVLGHLGLTQEELADAMSTSRFTVNQIVADRRSVTAKMALKLSASTGTSVDIWLNLQRNVDLFDAYQSSSEEIEHVVFRGRSLGESETFSDRR